MKALWIILLAGSALGQTCRSNQYDMLEYLSPWAETEIGGSYNHIYPSSGIYYRIKNEQGWPWDEDSFDSNYLYNIRTEITWQDPPSHYKEFEQPLPWFHRCIDIPGGYYDKIDEVDIHADATWFDIHAGPSCSDYTRHNLGYVKNEVWGPAPDGTLTHAYYYSCDSNYNKCLFKEETHLQKDIGMTEWIGYVWSNGQWHATGSQSLSGPEIVPLNTVNAVHPCW